MSKKLSNKEKLLLQEVLSFPLFKTFTDRRGRRFGLGYELSDIPKPFKSNATPVSLTNLETALLCWAGDGTNGLALGDINIPNHVFSWSGKTHPAPGNDFHTNLVYLNDDGAFLYRPKPAKKLIEYKTNEDFEGIVEDFDASVVQIAKGRPDIGTAGALPMNLWHVNKPGSTLFLPITDFTAEYINFLMVTFEGMGIRIFDDIKGKPAGIQKWIDNGYLKGPEMPLRMQDQMMKVVTSCVANYICEHISLTAQAMGLGSLVFAGVTPLVILGGTPFTQGLGFRFISDKQGMPVAVGKDGFLEAHCPPYFPSMNEAVDDVMKVKFGPGGPFGPDPVSPPPFNDPKEWEPLFTAYRPETVQCTKDFCNYIWETYGRFPATVESMDIPIAVTVHHVDPEFYDRFYPKEAVPDYMREHLKHWHEG